MASVIKRKPFFELDASSWVFSEIKKRDISQGLNINVQRFYTNTAGTILDKNTVPASLQTKFPFYLFGEFDKQGGYRLGNQITFPVIGGLIQTLVVRGQYDFTQFTGANNVRDNFNIGDFILLYGDSLTAPTYLIWILISCPFQSYASVVGNTKHLPLKTHSILYKTDNQLQYNETLSAVRVNQIGVFETKTYQPLANKNPLNPQDDFIEMLLPFTFSQYLGMYSYFQFDTELVNLNFTFK